MWGHVGLVEVVADGFGYFVWVDVAEGDLDVVVVVVV